jgi:NADP-dependent 3-hydroxy acid dehydrogenase YdfG
MPQPWSRRSSQLVHVTMVALSDAQSSNTNIATSLPAGMVAVFVGGTSGIGEFTLKNFAQHAKSPKIYLVGRSQDAADRITQECVKLNPDGEYIFIRSDVSLLKNVQSVCEQILSKESSINLLFQTQGGLQMESELFASCTCFENVQAG